MNTKADETMIFFLRRACIFGVHTDTHTNEKATLQTSVVQQAIKNSSDHSWTTPFQHRNIIHNLCGPYFQSVFCELHIIKQFLHPLDTFVIFLTFNLQVKYWQWIHSTQKLISSITSQYLFLLRHLSCQSTCLLG